MTWVEAILRAPIFLLMWGMFLGLKIVVVILGLLLVPLLYRYRDTSYAELPSWSRPWANPEDWKNGAHGFAVSLPPWWVQLEGLGAWSFYRYHALRNPANGLRSYEWLDLDVDMRRVRYVGDLSMTDYEPDTVRDSGKKQLWYLCWQGWRAGLKYMRPWSAERHMVIKLGWRVEPRDAHEQAPIYRGEDAGFATKVLLFRRG